MKTENDIVILLALLAALAPECSEKDWLEVPGLTSRLRARVQWAKKLLEEAEKCQ